VLDGVELPVRANLGILRPADFVHRPAGGGGSGATPTFADWRADRRGAPALRIADALSKRVSFAVTRLSLEAAA